MFLNETLLWSISCKRPLLTISGIQPPVGTAMSKPAPAAVFSFANRTSLAS